MKLRLAHAGELAAGFLGIAQYRDIADVRVILHGRSPCGRFRRRLLEALARVASEDHRSRAEGHEYAGHKGTLFPTWDFSPYRRPPGYWSDCASDPKRPEDHR